MRRVRSNVADITKRARARLRRLLASAAIVLIGSTGLGSRPALADEPTRDQAPGADWADARRWSATIMGQIDGIHSDQDDDGVGGFFDQYEFTPNKDPGIGFQIGVRDASFDWIEDRRPVLQLRFESPSANLGLSGDDIDKPFLNQRADLRARSDSLRLDADYRRFRTEELRRFPETEAGGGALPFTDLTGRNDRFYRERTGFQTNLRWQPGAALTDVAEDIARTAPVLSLRGGFERRRSQRQLRTLLEPGNDWLTATDDRGDEVRDVGAGAVWAPIDDFTLTVDYDYQEFDADDALLDSTLPFASSGRSLAFLPSTERHTARVFAHGRVADRAVVTAGFQATRVEQDSPRTPAQGAAGFDENETIAFTAQVSGDLRISEALTARAFAKYAYRDHDLDRSTALFNPDNGTQVDEFLRKFLRFDAEGELRYRLNRRARVAGGVRLLVVDRDLDFPTLGLANPVIQPDNALIDDQTRMWTFFLRGQLRPRPTLSLRGEIRYRIAPETGYVTDLDQYLSGELRGTWSLPLRRPATASFFLKGGVGENTDFSFTEGLGPNPPGPSVDREFDRSHVSVGGTADWSWRDDLQLYGSLVYTRDLQGDRLLLSNLQRYIQEVVPITFRNGGHLDYESEEVSVVLGGVHRFDERTDAGLSYSYTQARGDYDIGLGRSVALIDDEREVDARIHAVEVELRHRLRDGIRLFLGYRIQAFSDGAPRSSTTGSRRRPPDRSDLRHAVRFGVTLSGDLLDRS
jgi:hypothetical protein